FPLAATLVRDRRTGEAPWAFLEARGEINVRRPRVQLVRPLIVGTVAGVGCLLAFMAHRASIHANVSMDTRLQDEFVLAFVFWQIVIGLVAQGVAAALAAGLSRDRVRIPEALFAATVTGSIATLGIVAGPVAGGCI